MFTPWCVLRTDRVSPADQVREVLSEAAEIAVAEPGHVQFLMVAISNGPQLSRGNQAESTPSRVMANPV